ncbi:hypothetical protein ACSQ67_009902 [Phaseolus vulgaris]
METLAEEAAWKFAKEHNIDLVTINPALVSGPLLQPVLNTSAAAVLNFVNGSPTFKNITLGWIDVRDVAMAHILAYENASANGRYLLVERVEHHSNAVKILRDLYPTLQLPEKCIDDKPYPPIYQVSKEKAKSLGLEYTPLETLAEEVAWKFAKENNIDLVTINPALVTGPLLQPVLNTSAAAVLNFVNGSPTFRNVTLGWIDVRDVANAHILAYENASANGRYLLVERVEHHSNAIKILRDLYPTIQLPEKCIDDKPYPAIYQVSKEKAKSLGLEYTPLEVSLKDTVESLKEKKFTPF